jgi:hypothetical protein
LSPSERGNNTKSYIASIFSDAVMTLGVQWLVGPYSQPLTPFSGVAWTNHHVSFGEYKAESAVRRGGMKLGSAGRKTNLENGDGNVEI